MSNDDVVDPACVKDIFATEVSSVEDLGSAVRIVFVVPGALTGGSRKSEKRRRRYSTETRERIACSFADQRTADLDLV